MKLTNILCLGLFTLSFGSCINKEATSSNNASVASEKSDAASLSSWSDPAKARIDNWLKTITDSSSKDYIPVADRIAVFDNDGTLWSEQPIPNQMVFAIDYLKALAAKHPEFLKDAVLKGIIDNDMEPLKKAGAKGLIALVNASHSDQTVEQFNAAVKGWIDTAKDKKFGKLYKDEIYEPMVELIRTLKANDFKVFIVSGGGADFMRVWCEDAYGIPPYMVIGSYEDTKFDIVDGKPMLTKIGGMPFIDDKIGKPVAIHRFIGMVPVFCAGNSDGDQAMLEYTAGSKYKSFEMLIHHTDSVREYKYDNDTHSGYLDKALIEAKERNWMVVDMKNDFKKIYPFQ